jgi:hypothetical protein
VGEQRTSPGKKRRTEGGRDCRLERTTAACTAPTPGIRTFNSTAAVPALVELSPGGTGAGTDGGAS